MKVTNKLLLAEFRTPGRCERCLRWFPRREGHHCLCCGAGGGGRMDIRQNLVCVGSSVPYPLCECHSKLQGDLQQSLGIVARREGSTAERVLEYLWLVRRLRKGSALPEFVK